LIPKTIPTATSSLPLSSSLVGDSSRQHDDLPPLKLPTRITTTTKISDFIDSHKQEDVEVDKVEIVESIDKKIVVEHSE
jgi:hypothetical protein